MMMSGPCSNEIHMKIGKSVPGISSLSVVRNGVSWEVNPKSLRAKVHAKLSRNSSTALLWRSLAGNHTTLS